MIDVLFRKAVGGGSAFRRWAGVAAGMMVVLLPCELENAAANGDTRTIQLYHAHTHESISATYLVNGSYDQDVLNKLNWFLRDWRRDEPTKMDPRLFDTIWEVYREAGSHQPIEVMSAYRSPETNAMLRRRSRGVAEHSQHILGKAMDQHYMDVPMSRIREIAMRLQRGGVGFYPTAGTPFVHMDVGGVRHWPRMSYDQLARLFPDGKTVHIPSNGQPLPGYEEARAELEARGDGSYPTASQLKSKGFFAWLFGSSSDDEDDAAEGGGGRSRGAEPVRNQRVASVQPPAGNASVAVYDASSKDGGSHSFFATQGAAPAPSPYGGVTREARLTPAPAPVAPIPAPPPPAPPSAAFVATTSEEGAGAQAAALSQAQGFNPAKTVPQLAVPTEALMSNGLTVPMPPRRPVEFASIAPDLPMPPSRPPELRKPIEAAAPTPATARQAKADGIGALLNRSGVLPDVITQGSSRHPGSAPQILAYAGGSSAVMQRAIGATATSVPLPVARPADLVQAGLDRSNFRNLTSAAKTEKTPTRAVLGSTVIGIRAASRAHVGEMASTAGVQTSFGSKASDLSTEQFSGSAITPTARLVTARPADAGKTQD